VRESRTTHVTSVDQVPVVRIEGVPQRATCHTCHSNSPMMLTHGDSRADACLFRIGSQERGAWWRVHLMSARSCETPPPGKAVLIWVSLSR
jgi:hypothetical protein